MDRTPGSGSRDRHDELIALFVRHEAAVRSFVLTWLLPVSANMCGCGRWPDVWNPRGLISADRFKI